MNATPDILKQTNQFLRFTQNALPLYQHTYPASH